MWLPVGPLTLNLDKIWARYKLFLYFPTHLSHFYHWEKNVKTRFGIGQIGATFGSPWWLPEKSNFGWLSVLCKFWAEFEYLHNLHYVCWILYFLCIVWFLFGLIWMRPDKVIRDTNSFVQQSQLTFTGQLMLNKKKPVFVVVCIPFSYLDKFFRDFRIFFQTLVNIWKLSLILILVSLIVIEDK